MRSYEIISYIVMTGVFLAGMIPIILGIVYYTKDNRRLDRERKNAEKAASHR